jgi:biopolymer transport protein ExbD
MVRELLLLLALLVQDPVAGPEPLQVRFVHDPGCTEKPCRKDRHWKFLAGEGVPGDSDDFSEAIQREADAHRTGAPRPELSERIVFFGGDRSVPWETVNWAMRRCALSGIYKMAWLKPGSPKAEMAHKFWLPEQERDSGLLRIGDAEITLRWDPAAGGLVRRIRHWAPATTLDALMADVKAYHAALRKSGKTEGPVLIDAGGDVLWKDVIEVMDRCRAEGFEKLELVPALRRKAAEKNPGPEGPAKDK